MSLLDALTVGLGFELALPGGDADPEGAVTYEMTMNVALAPDELLDSSPEDQAVLRALIGDQLTGADPEWVRVGVGSGDLVVCELLEPDLWRALDGRESDLSQIASAILDPSVGGLVEELEDALEGGATRLIIVNHVKVFPQWRGLGLGLLGTGLALQHLGTPGSCAALYPMTPGLESETDRAEAHARLSTYWGTLGFKPFRDGVHVLDLAMITLDDAMRVLRSRHQMRALP